VLTCIGVPGLRFLLRRAPFNFVADAAAIRLTLAML
jgi:hypothetical protein